MYASTSQWHIPSETGKPNISYHMKAPNLHKFSVNFEKITIQQAHSCTQFFEEHPPTQSNITWVKLANFLQRLKDIIIFSFRKIKQFRRKYHNCFNQIRSARFLMFQGTHSPRKITVLLQYFGTSEGSEEGQIHIPAWGARYFHLLILVIWRQFIPKNFLFDNWFKKKNSARFLSQRVTIPKVFFIPRVKFASILKYDFLE